MGDTARRDGGLNDALAGLGRPNLCNNWEGNRLPLWVASTQREKLTTGLREALGGTG